MANLTLQRLIDLVNNKIGDTSGGTVSPTVVTNFANEALRMVTREFNLPSSKFITPITLLPGVYKYALPSSFIDWVGISQQEVTPSYLDFWRTDQELEFWRNADGVNRFCFARNGANSYALINFVNPPMAAVTMNDCDSVTGNGTWSANTTTSDAANIATDPYILFQGSGSIKFDITVGQSVNNYAEISNSTMNNVDLSGITLANVGTLTCQVYLPSATDYTSFTMRWGADSSNYYESTVTTDIAGQPFVQGWNQLGFDWITATTVGSPTTSGIVYLLFRATYPASFSSQTGVHLDICVMRQKQLFNLHYMSNGLVMDSATSQPKSQFSDSSDTSSYFICDEEFQDLISYDVLDNVFAYYDMNDRKRLANQQRMNDLKLSLAEQFPSQRMPPTVEYSEFRYNNLS